MSFDPVLMKIASEKYISAREERRRSRLEWERQCHQRVPGLAELDQRISRTVAEVVAAALRHGVDPGPAVEEARKKNLAYQARRLEILREYDIDPASLEGAPACALCGDSGWVGGKPCACLMRYCVEENLKELGGQLELAKLGFDKFSLDWYSPKFDPEQGISPRECMETVLGTCRDYAAQFPNHQFRNLYLYGGTGLGKTLLSGCMAVEVAKRGFWTVYVTAGELFRQYENLKFGRELDTAKNQVRRFEKCELLVVDDLGSEMTTQLVQSALYEVLNQRLNEGKHTVISSNLDLDGVRARYTPQAASRLEGEYRGLPFLGEDIRLQKKRR